MGQIIDLLRRLPTKSPSQILNQLSNLHDRVLSGETIELPAVTIILSSGQSLRGIVLKLEQPTDCQDNILLLQSANQDVLYLLQSAVVGVTIHYNQENLNLLTAESSTYKPPQKDIVSRLDLNRQAQTLTTNLATSDIDCAIRLNWDLLPTTEPSMQVLTNSLQDLETILMDIQAETIGRIALATQVRSIELQAGTEANIRLAEQTLMLCFARLGNDLVPWPKARLHQTIEQHL